MRGRDQQNRRDMALQDQSALADPRPEYVVAGRRRAAELPWPGRRGGRVARRCAPWWDAFQDPALQALIQDALSRNYDVQIAAARVREARANLSVARSDLYRSFDYGGSVSRSKIGPGAVGRPGGPAPNATNFYSATMGASWELDVWGRIRRLNEAARANLFATEDARRGVWLTLVSDVAQAYFELLELDIRLEIARNSTDAYQRTYDLFLDRLNVGVASRLETSRALGALGDAQANIPTLESAIVAKENQISILLGRPPAPIARGRAMYEQLVVPTVPAGLPAALLERRPDLRKVEQQLVAANARIGVAKAEFFPKLSLTALFGTASPEVSALTGGTATIWAVAGMFSGPLFDAGRTLGTYRASIAQWEQAPVRAGRPPGAARGVGRAHCPGQAQRRGGTPGHSREVARGGRGARDRSLSSGAGQLLRGARSPVAIVSRAEHARADPPRPAPRLRPALQSARRRLEPHRRRLDRQEDATAR
jgi:NodT family efflux transporter outer membrane factor (OMF) lipoprotein